MLRADDDGVHSLGLAVLVLDRHLGFAVGLEVGDDAFFARDGQPVRQVVGEGDGERHEVGGLVAGEANHHALVAGAEGVDLVMRLAGVAVLESRRHAAANVRRLLVQADHDLARLVIDADLGIVVADLFHRLADQRLVVNFGRGGDLADHGDEVGAGGGLAGDPCRRVLRVDGVQDGVGHLVAELVGVPLRHGLRRVEIGGRALKSGSAFKHLSFEILPVS